MREAPYPELDDLLEMMGEACERPSAIDASEGAAGNNSVCPRGLVEPRSRIPVVETILSHVPRYQDEAYLNHHLLRWQPEAIMQLPEGIGFIPFRLPGSATLTAAKLAALRSHQIVVWTQHGVMARLDVSVKRSADRKDERRTTEVGCEGSGDVKCTEAADERY